MVFDNHRGTRSCSFANQLYSRVDGNKKQIPEDPISFDNISIIEDWITQNDLSLEDHGSSDWMSLVPPSVNTMPLVPSTDESEDVATGNCCCYT